jgi:hypothetical protein
MGLEVMRDHFNDQGPGHEKETLIIRGRRPGPKHVRKLPDPQARPKKRRSPALSGGTSCNLLIRKNLFLAILVSLVEHIDATSGVNELHLACVERVQKVQPRQWS